MCTGLAAPLPATGKEPVTFYDPACRTDHIPAFAPTQLPEQVECFIIAERKISRTDNERASAESRKCCGMVASECVKLDTRMPQVVTHYVSPCRVNLLIFANVQVLHNAGYHRVRLMPASCMT